MGERGSSSDRCCGAVANADAGIGCVHMLQVSDFAYSLRVVEHGCVIDVDRDVTGNRDAMRKVCLELGNVTGSNEFFEYKFIGRRCERFGGFSVRYCHMQRRASLNVAVLVVMES